MSYPSYALPVTDYTVKNALLWGNCALHFEKATHGTWGKRAVHAFIGFIELPPVLSQIVSIFEMVIAKYLIERFRRFTKTIGVSSVKELAPIVTEAEKKMEATQDKSPEGSESPEQPPNPPDAPIASVDASLVGSQNQVASPGVSPTNSETSTLSSDSDTPVSIMNTAELQLEGARQKKREDNSCLIA